MMRCFVAVDLELPTRTPLASLVREKLPRHRDVRWCTDRQLHITLKFLGEVSDKQITAVCNAVKEASHSVEPFKIRVSGLGAFPETRNPRVFWAGVEDPEEGCARWVAAADPLFAELGFPPEDRAYHPHITLGRVKGTDGGRLVQRLLSELTPPSPPAMTIKEIVLFESRLTPTGAIYTARYRAKLGGATQ